MENKGQSKDWRSDPRLAVMDEKKIAFLSEYAEKMKNIPKEKMLSFLITLRTEASKRHIEFSNSETMLIASILCTDMTPEQKKRMEMLRSLTQKAFR